VFFRKKDEMTIAPVIFRYPGGKSRRDARKAILEHMPPTESFQEFRDATVGGGGIFFAISEAGPEKRRWVNDADPHLMSVYQALVQEPSAFIKRCEEIPTAEASEERVQRRAGKSGQQGSFNARLFHLFERYKRDSTVDPALRYFFLNRLTWAGRVNYAIPDYMTYANEAGWNPDRSPHLSWAATLMRGVRVTTGDFAPVLSEPGEDVLVYVDPPYVGDTLAYPLQQRYSHCFSLDDHYRLAQTVRNCAHRVILTYEDHKSGLIRDLYPASAGFHLKETAWTYAMGIRGGNRRAQQLVITNYSSERKVYAMRYTALHPSQLKALLQDAQTIESLKYLLQTDLEIRRSVMAAAAGVETEKRMASRKAAVAGVNERRKREGLTEEHKAKLREAWKRRKAQSQTKITDCGSRSTLKMTTENP
jgi:DNA adenine methylase